MSFMSVNEIRRFDHHKNPNANTVNYRFFLDKKREKYFTCLFIKAYWYLAMQFLIAWTVNNVKKYICFDKKNWSHVRE